VHLDFFVIAGADYTCSTESQVDVE